MSEARAEKILKILLYVLCIWDLLIGLIMILVPSLVAEVLLTGENEDLFFVRATGISQLLAFYIQFLAARRGRRDATALRLSIVFRALFPPLYLCHIAFLSPEPTPLVTVSLISFSVLDYILVAALCRLAKLLFGKCLP